MGERRGEGGRKGGEGGKGRGRGGRGGVNLLRVVPMRLALFLAHFKKQFSSDAVCEVYAVEYKLEESLSLHVVEQ